MLNNSSVLLPFKKAFLALKGKLQDESGVGVIEVILILLVLVGLVIIFKDQITSLAKGIFSSINSKAGSI